MILYITSLKHGTHNIIIDDSDYDILKNETIYVWTTLRHQTFYAMIQVSNGKSLRLHRFLIKPGKNDIIDHINGNGLDNRRLNLRITNSTGNNQNARKRKNATTSSYKGVHYCAKHRRWKAQIQSNKIKYSLGTYKTEIEAANAYNTAAIKYFGQFAKLNDLK